MCAPPRPLQRYGLSRLAQPTREGRARPRRLLDDERLRLQCRRRSRLDGRGAHLRARAGRLARQRL